MRLINRFRECFAAGIVSLILFAGCGHNEKTEHTLVQSLAEIEVASVHAEQKNREQMEEVVGTLVPRVRSVISPKISGRIEELLVTSGQEVKEGQLIVRIEAQDATAKLAQAVALSKQAEQDLERVEKLLKQQAMTQQDYDAAVSRDRVARASVAGAESALGYAKITAPLFGIVTKKYADVGDFANTGMPLLEIISSGALRVEAEIPEAIIKFVKIGQDVAVNVSSHEKELNARVAEIVPFADPVSRTFLVRMDLPVVPGLMPGRFARVSIPVGTVPSIQIPSSAVVVRGQLEIVFVVKDDHAWIRLVKTGRVIGDFVEILSGLSKDEQVVKTGVELLQDGQPIKIKGAV